MHGTTHSRNIFSCVDSGPKIWENVYLKYYFALGMDILRASLYVNGSTYSTCSIFLHFELIGGLQSNLQLLIILTPLFCKKDRLGNWKYITTEACRLYEVSIVKFTDSWHFWLGLILRKTRNDSKLLQTSLLFSSLSCE